MKSPPEEITEERFIQSLECLPPRGWIQRGDTESFKISELLCGDIANIYARISERYFHLCDVVTLKHDEIIAMIQQSDVMGLEPQAASPKP